MNGTTINLIVSYQLKALLFHFYTRCSNALHVLQPSGLKSWDYIRWLRYHINPSTMFISGRKPISWWVIKVSQSQFWAKLYFLSGYSADRFGHKQVLIFTAILYAACGTLIDQTPRYKVYQNHPFVELTSEGDLLSFSWPSCHKNASCDNNIGAVHEYIISGSWIEHMTEECTDVNVTLPLVDDMYNTTTMVITNGTFCSMVFNQSGVTNASMRCQVSIADASVTTRTGISSCNVAVGDHTTTFVTYAVLVLGCRIGMNICFSLFDGTNMRYAQKYNGNFANTIIFSALGSLASSVLSGFLVVDNPDGSGQSFPQPPGMQSTASVSFF